MKILFLIGISILGMFSCSATKELKFDYNIWQDPESYHYQKDDITDRQKMLNSVLDLIQGKSKSEIIGLIGEGLDTAYFISTERDLIYILGPERSYTGIDSEWLLLWFDEDKMLLKYEITTD